MNKIGFMRKTVFAALFSLVLLSCATIRSGVRSLELGMTKSEVISKMGDDYEVETLRQTDRGNLEVLRYTQYTQPEAGAKMIPLEYYMLHFLNGKLVEVNKLNAEQRNHRPHTPPGK
jgi:hypothetical protein